MQLLNLISFIILINYHSADALPDTNIHIQRYDGPVYMSTPKPNCCPVCNSPLNPESIDNANDITCEPAPETVYPETTVYIKYPEDPTEEKSCGKSSRNCKNNPSTGNTNGIQVPDYMSKASGNYGPLLHTDTSKTGTGIHNIPVNCRTPCGNTYSGTGNSNPLATHFGYDTYGIGSYPSVATEPLSNYLPVTASQNSCYQVPILTYNSDQGGEPTLVPQKFMYSLILDGEVASNRNGYNNCKNCYY